MDLRRFEFDGRMEEKGGQQFVSGRGMFGDGFTRVHRIEPHGFMSNPMKGAKGVVITPHPDLAYILGLESPGLRPSGLPGGASALYDAHGNIMKVLMGDGVSIDVAGTAFTVRKGGVTMAVSDAGVDIAGGYLKVNGVRVDDTHVHGGVIPGGGNTSVPAG